MKTYTIVYLACFGGVTVFTTEAEDARRAYHLLEMNPEWPPIDTVYATIEHRVPRLTVQADGVFHAAYADGEVDLLVVDGHNDTVYDNARDQQGQFIPANRQAENLAHVLDDAYLWHRPRVEHLPEEIDFDFEFIADPERVAEFNEKVFQDAEWEA